MNAYVIKKAAYHSLKCTLYQDEEVVMECFRCDFEPEYLMDKIAEHASNCYMLKYLESNPDFVEVAVTGFKAIGTWLEIKVVAYDSELEKLVYKFNADTNFIRMSAEYIERMSRKGHEVLL